MFNTSTLNQLGANGHRKDTIKTDLDDSMNNPMILDTFGPENQEDVNNDSMRHNTGIFNHEQ